MENKDKLTFPGDHIFLAVAIFFLCFLVLSLNFAGKQFTTGKLVKQQRYFSTINVVASSPSACLVVRNSIK